MLLLHFLVSTLITSTSAVTYRLQEDLTSSPAKFFTSFVFFTGPDPSLGSAKYISQAAAAGQQIVGFNSQGNVNDKAFSILIGVSSNTSDMGRTSVRLEGKTRYNPGTLWAFDIAHIPDVCGTWPAIWGLGEGEWPTGGEIDIVENGNALDEQCRLTLHTTDNCSLTNTTAHTGYTGHLLTHDCDVNAPDQDRNAGCSIAGPRGSFGAAFNRAGGGAYAMEWTPQGFRVWFWPRAATMPASLSTDEPDSAGFGTPVAAFSGAGCDWQRHFRRLAMIINTALCGDWAGNPDVWRNSGCAAQTGFATCHDYVASPASNGAFAAGAYWEIRSARTFTRKLE